MLILENDWISTTNGLIALITGLAGLIGTGISAFFAIKAFIKSMKDKSKQEIWNTITTMASAAMEQAEKTGKTGADKKQMVIDSVKVGCKAAGIQIDDFIDQLSAYIDQCISFANTLNQKKTSK